MYQFRIRFSSGLLACVRAAHVFEAACLAFRVSAFMPSPIEAIERLGQLDLFAQ
jgi:hypothetical protein